MEALKTVLISKPSIKVVYFNENMEWLFHPDAKFPNAMTREEILEEAPEAKEEKPEPKKKK